MKLKLSIKMLNENKIENLSIKTQNILFLESFELLFKIFVTNYMNNY